jgi:hypothetical protein
MPLVVNTRSDAPLCHHGHLTRRRAFPPTSLATAIAVSPPCRRPLSSLPIVGYCHHGQPVLPPTPLVTAHPPQHRSWLLPSLSARLAADPSRHCPPSSTSFGYCHLILTITLIAIGRLPPTLLAATNTRHLCHLSSTVCSTCYHLPLILLVAVHLLKIFNSSHKRTSLSLCTCSIALPLPHPLQCCWPALVFSVGIS